MATTTVAPPEVKLSNEEISRYSRHLIMPEVGMEGQLKLKQAKVLMIGTGGLGAPLGMYLAAAGVGTLGIVDFDTVDESNLQRQIIHGQDSIGELKVDSAEKRMKDINPFVQINKYNVAFTSENALEIVKDYDIVVDGTDNFPTRYLVNDACVLAGKPNVYGSIFRFEGQVTVFNYEDGPNYRDLYPEPPPPGLVPSCAEGGVLGVLPAIVGSMQALETIKIILGKGDVLSGRLVLFDALGLKFRELKVRKNPDVPKIEKLIDYEQFCGVPAIEQEHVDDVSEDEVSVTELKKLMDEKADIFVLDVREPHEYQIAQIPGTTLIPLGEVDERIDELDAEADIIVHCRSGKRSATACNILQANGFKKVRNLTGGILAWAQEVDPSVPQY